MSHGRERCCFVLVHGTDLKWLLRRICIAVNNFIFQQRDIIPCPKKPGSWYSQFQLALSTVFDSAVVHEFYWDGALVQSSRYSAALRLREELVNLKTRFDNIFIIAHSHGGNVAMQTVNTLNVAGIYLITLATPFIWVNNKGSIGRAWRLLFGIMLLLLLYPVISDGWTIYNGADINTVIPHSLFYVVALVVFLGTVILLKLDLLLERKLDMHMNRTLQIYDGLSMTGRVPALILKDKSDFFNQRNLKAFSRALDKTYSQPAYTLSRIFKVVIPISFFSLSLFILLFVIAMRHSGAKRGLKTAVELISYIDLAMRSGFGLILLLGCGVISILLVLFLVGYLMSLITSLNPLEFMNVSASTKTTPKVDGDLSCSFVIEYVELQGKIGYLAGLERHSGLTKEVLVFNTIINWVHRRCLVY